MYTLYIGNKNYSSWSLRPWILLTELGIEFNEQLIPFDDGGSWEKFRAFSPTGLVPCLHDGDAVVWESLAITEYLAESHPQVWPADRLARAWARSATSEMHAGFATLRNLCPMSVGLRLKLRTMPDALQQDLDRITEIWTQGLERFGGSFLAGERFDPLLRVGGSDRFGTDRLRIEGRADGVHHRRTRHQKRRTRETSRK